MVLVESEEVIGYCGVIPVGCRVGNQVHDALWWVDLVIHPAHRGRGLQTLFDERIRSMSQLKLGFPNALAAKIHRKHGWGVREDYETLLLPLRPRRLRAVSRARGWKKLGLQTAATAIEPAAAIVRKRLLKTPEDGVDRSGAIDASTLANLFDRSHPREHATAARDPAYLEWRYGCSPDRDELTCYVADGQLAAVVRTLHDSPQSIVRILDLFGSFENTELMHSLLRAIGHDAAQSGASQVTLFSTLPAIGSAARRVGFRLPGDGRFCWYSAEQSLHELIGTSPHHWVLGDSDHDEPL